jgi:hypothetical protein
MEEAEDIKPIRTGPFKKKTGKDRLWKRGLFQEGSPMILQTTFIGVGNEPLAFSGGGGPVEERFAIVPIRSQRDATAPTDEAEQYRKKKFLRDNFFDQEIEYYGAVGLWVLVEYYGRYLEEKLKPYPADMKKHTERYWNERDKYCRFTKEIIEVTKRNEDLLEMDVLYEVFKEWHERSYPKTAIPNIDKVRCELRNRWGKMKNGRFMGVKIKRPERKKRDILIRDPRNNNDEELEQI